jgi:hypothetical protein
MAFVRRAGHPYGHGQVSAKQRVVWDSGFRKGRGKREAATGSALNHRQRSGTGPAWKRSFDSRHFGITEFKLAGLRVVDNMFRCRCLRNREHGRISQQEPQRHLTWGGAMKIRYLLQ